MLNREMFVKMYLSTIESGLLRELGLEGWITLCVLALHMDDDGLCYPTQEQIAEALGISRTRANTRIKELTDFRFYGKPLVEVVQDDRRNNTYRDLRMGSRVSGYVTAALHI